MSETTEICEQVLISTAEVLRWHDREGGDRVAVLGELIGIPIHEVTEQTDYGRQFGRFVVLWHSPLRKRLSVYTDRYGLLPFFVSSTAGRVRLGTHPRTLLEDSNQPADDPQAMAEMLAFNQPVGNRTHWRSVRRIGAATCLVVDLEHLQISSHCTWDKIGLLSTADLALEDVQADLERALLEGCERAAAGSPDCAVTLSGGIDSRLVLAAMLAAGKQVSAWSTGVAANRAVAYAHAMAMRTQIPHHMVPLNTQFIRVYPDLVAANVVATQGMSLSSEAEARWLRDHVPAETRMMHGAFGELYKIGAMHSFAYTPGLAAMSPGQLADRFKQALMSRYSARRALIERCLGLDLVPDPCAGLNARIDELATRLSPAGICQALYLEEFLGKVTGISLGFWNERLPTVCPLSYPPFVDLLLRVRAEDKIGTAFPLRALRRLNPALLEVPDSNTGVPIGASAWLAHWRRGVDWGVRKLRRRRNLGEHHDPIGWLQGMSPPLTQRVAELSGRITAGDTELNRLYRQATNAGDRQAAELLLVLLVVAHARLR